MDILLGKNEKLIKFIKLALNENEANIKSAITSIPMKKHPIIKIPKVIISFFIFISYADNLNLKEQHN